MRSRNALSGLPAGVRRHRPDMLLLLFMSILLLLGLIIIYAISPALLARSGSGQSQAAFMLRQFLYLGIGVAAFVATSVIPIDFWRRHKGWLLIGSMGIGVLPFLLQATPMGLCVNGACRWIDLGSISFQPAELMKFALLIFLAAFLSVRMQQSKLNDLHQTLIPVGVVLLAMAVIVIGIQRDLGTGLTVFAIVITMLFMAGLKSKYFMAIIVASIGLGIVFTITAPHRIERIVTFFNHTNGSSSVQDTASTTGYHINQALIAVGSGGLMGKGLGQSIQAFGYLPEAANDSIFAIVAEKFGFVGTVAILAIFAGLLLRIRYIMDRTVNPFYRLIVAGVFGWIFAHTVVNICAMLGIFPLTGITLPFVSFGGTSLLFMLCILGLVFQISRYTSHQVEAEGGMTHEDRRSGRGIGRTRHASRRSFA